jgi:hypothetical protein
MYGARRDPVAYDKRTETAMVPLLSQLRHDSQQQLLQPKTSYEVGNGRQLDAEPTQC